MRRTAGLAAFAVAAATAAALPLTTATSAQGAPAAPTTPSAPRSPGSRPTPVRPERPTARRFVARETITDADGSTHVRFDRTLDGLRVVGGDLVVHSDASDAWAGVSQTLTAPLTVGTEASVPATTARRTVLTRTARTSAVRGDDTAEASELVVDATRRCAAPGVGGRHRRHPGRRHPVATGDVRRRPDRHGHPQRAADRQRRRHRADALQRHGAAERDRIRVVLPAQERRRPRQHLHDRHEERRGLGPLPALRRRLLDRHRDHLDDDHVRQRPQNSNRATAGRRRAVRLQRDVGLLPGHPRPQRHLRRRQRLLQPGPLRQELRQRLLGRHRR